MTTYKIIDGGEMECVPSPWNKKGYQKPYYLYEHQPLISQHLPFGVF
jgi:hypothetical protein